MIEDARLVLGQDQFAEAGARAGAEEADVVGDLEAGHGDGLDRARHEHHGVMGGERLELVGRGDEGQAGDRGDVGGDLVVPALAVFSPVPTAVPPCASS